MSAVAVECCAGGGGGKQQSFGSATPPGRAVEAGPPPQWVWKTGHQTKEDFSQASRSNAICLTRFWNYIPPDRLFFFPSNFSLLEWECLSFGCPTIVFGNIQFIWFHRFTAGEEYCLSMDHTSVYHPCVI